MPDSPDTPFGPLEWVLGLRVRDRSFEEGEKVRWEARANHFQHALR